MTAGFIFATGIEASIPTIHDGAVRMDEMEKCGRYLHWRTDFELVEEMGINFLRYGLFVPSESSEYYHVESPRALKPAELENTRRFFSLDLNYGRRVDSETYQHLMDNGMTPGRLPLLPEKQPEASLHHAQRLLRVQRAHDLSRRQHARIRRSSRLFDHHQHRAFVCRCRW
jgi:hypothetical protein